MTKNILAKKTERYLCGASSPAERKQIQHWLSCIDYKKMDTVNEEREQIENEILAEVQAYTAYPLFFPKETPWWKKANSFF